MFTPQILIPLLIEIVVGAAGALLVANMVPPLSLGHWKNIAVGAVGGLVLTWLTGHTPGLEKYVGYGEGAGAAGLPPDLLVGVGIAGLIGGALLLTVVGLLRNRARA